MRLYIRDDKETIVAKNDPWLCSCSISMREIRARINFGRELLGLRPLTMNRFYGLRAAAAEKFLEAHESRRHGNKGLDRNPFLPNRMIGNNYIFTAARANRLIRMGVAHKVRNTGRKPGSRVIKGRVLQPAGC